MSFNRTQLANASKVDAIAAVAMQTGEIDTRLLTPADRESLLLVLSQDVPFKSKHRASLVELAEEVRADRGHSPQPSTASVAVPNAGNKNFSSRQVANEQWAQNKACSQVTARKVIGGHPEETRLSLDFALWEWTPSRRLGTELRLIVPVRLGGAWKELPVLMKWDISGLATVRVVSGTAVRSSPPKPAAELAKIIGGQGVTVDDLASWSAPQLQEFAIAVGLMAKMDPNAIRAIKGITLEYTEQADTRLVNPHAANYRFEPAQNKATILLRQRVFDEDATRFAGSEQGKLHCNSTMIIAHELGHAVEQHDYRREWGEKAKYVGERDAACRQFGKVKDHYLKTLSDARDGLVKSHQSAVAKQEACRAKWDDLKQTAKKAYAAHDKIIDDWEEVKDDPEKMKGLVSLEEFCKTVKAAEVASYAELSDAADSSDALGSLCDVAGSAIAAAEVGIKQMAEDLKEPTLPLAIHDARQLVNNVHKLCGAEAARHPSAAPSWHVLNTTMVPASRLMLLMLDKLDSAAEAVRAADFALGTVVDTTSTGAIGSTKCLQNFVDFVARLSPDDQRRVIGITPYAQENWPKYPQELFAEAYAIWLTDTPRLIGVAPELAKYFATGKHLRNNP